MDSSPSSYQISAPKCPFFRILLGLFGTHVQASEQSTFCARTFGSFIAFEVDGQDRPVSDGDTVILTIDDGNVTMSEVSEGGISSEDGRFISPFTQSLGSIRCESNDRAVGRVVALILPESDDSVSNGTQLVQVTDMTADFREDGTFDLLLVSQDVALDELLDLFSGRIIETAEAELTRQSRRRLRAQYIPARN